ncbi:MAG: multifunctional CCA addition/repair protein [Woeseiaceae bacterium]|nr:multifunctional CCA addition/repair protein [Woeseiaceae bacterium]
MQVYLVGGAVRDELLGIPARERDWCVVGAAPDDLLERGFKPVGKDFPVFLHPESGEEYALARTERKTAPGYHGFHFDTSPDVTIEDDLSRRDLTINAMARDEAGALIDPFGGAADIEALTLRHVSAAFVEDPVRILRTARFAARFHSRGFRIADETLALMQRMVENGEADALVPDRVWKETELALGENDARVFFEALRACGALRAVFPEIDALFGVPQPEKWHPEIDTGLHTMMVLDQASRLSADVDVRFAALVHDLGKATTRPADLPSHPGHEKRSVKLIERLAARLPVPRHCRELAKLVAEFHTHCHRAFELRDATIVRVLERCDAFRRPDRFEKFLLTCEADARGRTGLENRDYRQVDLLRAAQVAAAAVDGAEIAAVNAKESTADAIRAARTNAVHEVRKGFADQLPP